MYRFKNTKKLKRLSFTSKSGRVFGGNRAYFSGRNNNKKAFIITAFVTIAALVIATVILLPGSQRADSRLTPSPGVTSENQATPNFPTLNADITPRPEVQMYTNVKEIKISERQINVPGVYRHEILFSAGSGSIDKPVLKNLYYYDTITQTATKIWESKIRNGEIYETCISENWFVWLDTDQYGNNALYKYNRANKEAELIRECGNNIPKLRLYGDWLVWMEQVDSQTDVLRLVDLSSGEEVILHEFTDPNYGMSSPCIYKDTVVFAGPHPEYPNVKSLSSIYIIDLNKSVDGELVPEIYTPGGYVHEPVSNGEAIAWIDTNKSPDARLFIQYGDNQPKFVAKGVSSYSIGDEYIVYNLNQVIYAYFYKTDILARLSEEGQFCILPVANENTIVWFDTTDGDVLKYKILE
ncbi:MAG TPA: hypothetical protein PLZ84_03825 [Clostridia bacterium]|nr:hypothetical protein [Clostridia bacterium]